MFGFPLSYCHWTDSVPVCAGGWSCSGMFCDSRFLTYARKISRMSLRVQVRVIASFIQVETGQDVGATMKEVKVHIRVDMDKFESELHMWSVRSWILCVSEGLFLRFVVLYSDSTFWLGAWSCS